MFTLKGNFKVSKLLNEHIRQVKEYLNNVYSDQQLSEDIYSVLMGEIINKKNWNPEARYSNRAPIQAGQIFDLTLSGQLLKTIENKRFNVVREIDDETSWVRIGNIAELDSLRSKRAEYGSTGGSVRSQNAPYWRFVVFGHRPPRRNFTFEYGTGMNGKDNGAIVPGLPKMRGTPPTYMFSNGLKVALPQIDQLIENKLIKDIQYLDDMWKSGGALKGFKPGYMK